jgi:arginase
MPEVLRWHGLRTRIGARDGGRIEAPPYRPERHPSGIRNAEAIADYALRQAEVVDSFLLREELPIVLGGDCSILLGNLLAARRHAPRLGLVFLDGHADYNTPTRSETQGAAGMDLALATGLGPPLLASLAPEGPLVRPEAVIHLGLREEDLPLRTSEISVLDLQAVTRLGAAETVAWTLDHLEPQDGYWIHVDADVLDDAIMPAVDSRYPGGLSYETLVSLLRPLLASSRALGVEFTIYDPDLDPDGSIGRAFTGALVEALRP